MKKLAPFFIALVILLLSACSLIEDENFSYSYDNDTGTYAVKYYNDLKSVTSITVPDMIEGAPVTSILAHALSNSNYLTEIIIGANISYIDLWAIRNNPLLQSITVSADNPYYASYDGVLYDKNLKTLIAYPNNKGESFTVPEGVETIADTAFYKCANLQEVTLASTVTSIGSMSFLKCTSLASVNLDEALASIGDSAFLGCTEISSITIPSTIGNIGEYAFYNCVKLSTVNVLRPESDITLGKKWYPTKNGQTIKELVINFSEVNNG